MLREKPYIPARITRMETSKNKDEDRSYTEKKKKKIKVGNV